MDILQLKKVSAVRREVNISISPSEIGLMMLFFMSDMVVVMEIVTDGGGCDDFRFSCIIQIKMAV